ncbi:MAG: hypothetical protein WD379_10305 [Dehalococcoidia bacterium]
MPEDTPRQHIPITRLFLLTVVTAALAFVLQTVLAVTDAPAGGVVSLVVVPLVAGIVVLAGARPYPLAGRARLALMVAGSLFVLGLLLS